MKCNKCKHWNGRSEWGDCYYIISTLVPTWSSIRTRFGFPVTTPFDPHDAKYVESKIPRPKILPDGVKIQVKKEKDIWFDDDGNERTRTVRLDFYRTHKDYSCEYEEL